jgi:nicotinate-nucleotide pyrophosphorylase (carboxylating)
MRTRVAVEPLPHLMIEPIVRAALEEDFGLGGDVTSEATIPHGTQTIAALVARERGVLAGIDCAVATFRMLDPHVRVDVGLHDGSPLEPGTHVAAFAGDARAILGAERTALNMVCHLSGIATATAALVAAVAGTRAVICETRKTTPGFRALEKYAVRAGGGKNHRFRLDDAMLIKDNHIAVAGGIGPALRAARARAGHLMRIEIEVDTLDQLDEVLATPCADVVLLDNFSVPDLAEAVRRVAGRLVIEASGGVRLDNVAAIAATGVDVISVGGLTHTIRALDIGLDIVASAVKPSSKRLMPPTIKRARR